MPGTLRPEMPRRPPAGNCRNPRHTHAGWATGGSGFVGDSGDAAPGDAGHSCAAVARGAKRQCAPNPEEPAKPQGSDGRSGLL